jgi:outer membrane immunogenic protein
MKLKQHLLASALCVVPFAASAADLPMKAPPVRVVQPIPFTWTGFYVGGSAGFISQNTQGTDLGGPSGGDGLIGRAGDQYGISGVGGLFGVNVGYNWQFDPRWVLGIEADIAGSTINNTFNFSSFRLPSYVSSKLSSLGTVRGRIGYAFDRVLLYATGGFAYGHVQNGAAYNYTNTANYTVSTSGTRTGWTAGAGLEYAYLNNWTVRVEGLYVDLGSTTGSAPGSGPTSGCRFGFKNRYTLGRIGLNYKF